MSDRDLHTQILVIKEIDEDKFEKEVEQRIADTWFIRQLCATSVYNSDGELVTTHIAYLTR